MTHLAPSFLVSSEGLWDVVVLGDLNRSESSLTLLTQQSSLSFSFLRGGGDGPKGCLTRLLKLGSL